MTTTRTQEELDLFVAGLLEEGPLLDALRAELESPNSQVSQHLKTVFQEAQRAFRIDWSNVLSREAMNEYSALIRCFGAKLSDPNPAHRNWFFYWYVCGRKFFSNAHELDMRWTHAEWDLVLRQMIQNYAQHLAGIRKQPERIHPEEADILDAILDVLSELASVFRTPHAQEQLKRLPDTFYLDVIDVFFEWDPRWNNLEGEWILPPEPPQPFQKLLAFTYVIANHVLSAAHLEKSWRELLLALGSCLRRREPPWNPESP